MALSIAYTSVASSFLHLAPHRSVEAQITSAFFDKLGIVVIGVCNNVLIVRQHSMADPARLIWLSSLVVFLLQRLATAVARRRLPNSEVILLSAWLLVHRLVFEFFIVVDGELRALIPGLCYAAGAAFYVFQYPWPAAKWWGYHECMHVSVTLGWAVNLYISCPGWY